jgi:predicted RNA methylase
MNPEDIDWNEVWNQKYETSLTSRKMGGNLDFRDSKTWAYEFVRSTAENPARFKTMLSDLSITAQNRILDIGSGPGTLSIPAAKDASYVTAVEPAAGMVAVLRERAEKEQVTDKIIVIQKRWEDVDINKDLSPPYNLVVAANSLDMPDISMAIDKMVQICRGEIWLYWFAGTTTIEIHYKKLWPLIFNCPFYEGPKADIIFQVLYNKGIYPDISFETTELVQSFPSMDAAVENLRQKIGCNEQYDDIIRTYLSGILEYREGLFLDKTSNTRAAIRWENSKF